MSSPDIDDDLDLPIWGAKPIGKEVGKSESQTAIYWSVARLTPTRSAASGSLHVDEYGSNFQAARSARARSRGKRKQRRTANCE